MTGSDLTPSQRNFIETFVLGRRDDDAPDAENPERALGKAMEFLVFQARFFSDGEVTLEDVLESGPARRICPWAGDLDGPARDRLTADYIVARKGIARLETQVQGMIRQTPGARLDIEAALDGWAAQPQQAAAWFMTFLAQTMPAPPARETDPVGLMGSVHRLLARAPLADVDATQLADVVAINPGTDAAGRKVLKVVAPLSVLDADSRHALYGTDNLDVNVMEDIVGTGGIGKIVARRHDDRSMEVEITGEILPGRQEQRTGMESAGFFSYDDLEDQGKLRQTIDGDPNKRWERLHLWGPGFGDEAAAGIYLGPRAINQDDQNRGIEKLIRHLGKLVLPLRDHGYRLFCTAHVQTWPEPSPNGFLVERVFRRVEYEISLITPGGVHKALAGLEMITDPADYNDGARLDTTVWGGGRDWDDLFTAVPDTLPVQG